MKTQKQILKQLMVLGMVLECGMLAGCGDFGMGAPEIPYQIESYNMDGTKLIVNGLRNQNDEATYNQDQYILKADQRLLIRFETLDDHVHDIKNSWDNEIHLRLVPTGGTDAEALKNSVKLCPVIKNWMMLATWYNAHPFNKEGKWTTPGGDYDSSGCITGEVQNPDGQNPDASPSPSPSPHAQPSPTPYGEGYANAIDKPSVIFDIKHWFESNPMGRNVNYGFILVSTNAVNIYGDRSNSYSPRIYWKMPKNYYQNPDGTLRHHGILTY